MIVRAVWVNLRVFLGGRRFLWLVGGLLVLWLFAYHLLNPWDILLNVTDKHSFVFVAVPLYSLLINGELRNVWQSTVAIRLGSSGVWWLCHVVTSGVVAFVTSVGLAVLTTLISLVTQQWSWQWGYHVRHSEPPGILTRAPWSIPWHWGIDALAYFAIGLWVIGVLLHALTLWWRSAWLAWGAVVGVGLASEALGGTVAQPAVWWLPGIQFSFYYHWGPSGPIALAWTLVYAVVLLGMATAAGWFMANRDGWHSAHGEGL